MLSGDTGIVPASEVAVGDSLWSKNKPTLNLYRREEFSKTTCKFVSFKLVISLKRVTFLILCHENVQIAQTNFAIFGEKLRFQHENLHEHRF